MTNSIGFYPALIICSSIPRIAKLIIPALLMIVFCSIGLRSQTYNYTYTSNVEYGQYGMNQVKITNDAHFSSGSTDGTEGSSATNWGDNDTYSSTTNQLLIGGTGTIGSIINNFWTAGLSPATSGYIANTVSYTAVSSGDWLTSKPSRNFDVSCNAVYPPSKPKGNNFIPQAALQFDSCAYFKRWMGISPSSEEEYKEQYDTLRLYIEKCAVSDSLSYRAFSHLDGAVQFMSSDTNRFITYRNWLISVLYLNTTKDAYFCNCMGSIASTYQIGKFEPLGYLAILNYLKYNHPSCWSTSAQSEYDQDSTYDHSKGYDPTKLPSLDSMGLGFLLNNQGVSPTSPLPFTYLASFTTNPNPFVKQTTLEFTLNRMAYIQLEIYDELGRLVWGDGRGSSLEPGMHSVLIDGANLPSGTLYARISTGFGEVKTVKLVHEK
jgi:hypothetical protein